jgi:hypothetical protein
MNVFKITVVRHSPAEADALLNAYVFGGRYGGPRVPRGIAPHQVSIFVKTSVLPTADATDLGRLLEVLRFYEPPDCVGHLMKFLSGRENDNADVRRSLLILQIAGDIGEEPEARQAAAYLDERLVDRSAAVGEFPILFQTLLALAPHGSMDRSEKRLAADLKRAQAQKDASEEGLRAFTLLTTADAECRRVAKLRAAKARIAALPPDKRIAEFVAIYLGESSLSTSYMEIWAARQLRREAYDGDTAGVLRELGRYLTRALPPGAREPGEPFHFVRAAQALVYLGGTLLPAQKAAYDKINERTLNFLWDDPPEPVAPRKPGNGGGDTGDED